MGTETRSGMQWKETLLALAMCGLCATGLAPQSPLHGGRGINKMFLDARAPELPPRYSQAEIKEMIHDAKSPEDFRRLANYFDYQALEFQQKTEEQVKELERLLALPYHARSYPSQVETTRDLITQYRTKMHECAAQADAYRQQTTVSDSDGMTGVALGGMTIEGATPTR
jgi:hypothetical protein